MTLRDFIPILRNLFWFDLETTGQNPQVDRIVEIGFTWLKPSGPPDLEWSKRVNPTIPIPYEATHGNGAEYPGHGITNEDVKDAPTFAELAPALLKGFHDCDYGGFNVKTYDLPLLQAEFTRAGLSFSYANARIIDGYRIWQLGQKRSLSDGVEQFLGRKHEGAHGVMADVRASLEVVVAQLQAFTTLPKTLEQLHQLQWPTDPSWIDATGKFKWRDGVATLNFGKKHNGKPLHLVPRDYLMWMTKPEQNFPDDAKRIATEMLAGRLPQRRDDAARTDSAQPS